MPMAGANRPQGLKPKWQKVKNPPKRVLLNAVYGLLSRSGETKQRSEQPHSYKQADTENCVSHNPSRMNCGDANRLLILR